MKTVLVMGGVAAMLSACETSGDSRACLDQAAALAPDGTAASCTALVRLSTVDHSILGWSLDCGPSMMVNEVEAREHLALPDLIRPEDLIALEVPSPDSHFIFYAPPNDFGGLAVVSQSTGRTQFVGRLSFSSLGGIEFPKAFRPPSELPTTCNAQDLPHARGIQPSVAPTALDDALVSGVLGGIRRTPIIPALQRSLLIQDALVVAYDVDMSPAGIQGHEIAKNEWIVLVTALKR